LLLLLLLLLTQRVYEDGDVITYQGDTADDSCFIVAQVKQLFFFLSVNTGTM
jgi:hypothetical protein